MTYTATLTFDEPLVRRAAFAFWRRSVGIAFPIVLIGSSIYAIHLVTAARSDWMTGVTVTIVAMGFVMTAAVFLVHYRNGLQKLRDMGSPIAELTAQRDSLTVTSGIGSSSMKWSSITTVWCFDGFWLLLFSKAHYMTLPIASVSAEMQAFVLERVQTSGGKVDAR